MSDQTNIKTGKPELAGLDSEYSGLVVVRVPLDTRPDEYWQQIFTAALFLGATTKTNANSAAKIAQMAQFAIVATVAQAPDETSRSMISTGIKANVATRITGSNGCVTRPFSDCCHIEPPFAAPVRFP